MKPAIVIVSAVVLATIAIKAVSAAGQSGQGPTPAAQSLVEVAKAEEARRKGVRKPAKVYTNADLKGEAPSVGAATPTPATLPAATPSTPAADDKMAPVAEVPSGSGSAAAKPRDQAYWGGRITAARTAFDRASVVAEALQSRINALATDFVNRDDPAQRAQIANNRKAALAELDRVKKEMEAHLKEIADTEDEARRAGVPAGWLRPGA